MEINFNNNNMQERKILWDGMGCSLACIEQYALYSTFF